MSVMNYFDYSATTPLSKSVNQLMQEVETSYYANINAKHDFGVRSKAYVQSYIESMAKSLSIPVSSLIFTSGATESNNMILFGLAKSYPHKKHILTTSLEHHSMISPCGELQRQGYEIEFIPYNQGQLDLKALKDMIRDDTLCVSVIAVESETGLIHPLNSIKAICDDRHVPLHSDMTQAIGKMKVDFKDVTYASFSAHKIYGPKGIGACVILKEDIKPLILGGRSLTKLRAGTPPNALIVGFAQSCIEAIQNLEHRISEVEQLRKYFVNECASNQQLHVNQPKHGVPHILNVSLVKSDRHEIVRLLSLENCYVSASSACSGQENVSKAVLTITQNMDFATSSIRISLSHLTNKEEIIALVEALKKVTL